MSQHPNLARLQFLVLERVDPARNVSRYYVLSIAPSLFGDTLLTREWGRIGLPGGQLVALYRHPNAARIALDEWLRRKTKRGYRIAYSQADAANNLASNSG